VSINLLFALSTYCLFSIIGLYKLKKATRVTSWSFVVGFFLYGLGFLIWMYMLRAFPLSLIFPLCSTALLIGTQIVGWFFLRERMSVRGIMAVLLACVATFLISIELSG